MKIHNFHVLVYLLSLLLLFVAQLNEANLNVDKNENRDELGKTTAQIIRQRGFLAENYLMTTSDGYIINIVKATNPLINNGISGLPNKDPILFIHGILLSANSFLVNDQGVEPKDFGQLDAGLMSIEELIEILGDEPSTGSLPFLALNFGHEVWLMNRRGTYASLAHEDISRQPFKKLGGGTNSVAFSKLTQMFSSHAQEALMEAISTNTSSSSSSSNGRAGTRTDILGLSEMLRFQQLEGIVNTRYWNYSFDQQAYRDVPETIDFVLDKSGYNKVALVGHSAGGGLALMSLSVKPKLSEKLSKVILWAPSVDLPRTKKHPAVKGFLMILDDFKRYIVPVVPPYLEPILQGFLAETCQLQPIKGMICKRFLEFLFGEVDGDQLDITPGFFNQLFDTLSTHEAVSLFQSMIKGHMTHFDYESPRRNMIAYRRKTPPIYDLSKVRKSVYIWIGNTDSLVTPEDTFSMAKRLKVPYDLICVNQTGIKFNHVDYFTHRESHKLAILPSLKQIESPSDEWLNWAGRKGK